MVYTLFNNLYSQVVEQVRLISIIIKNRVLFVGKKGQDVSPLIKVILVVVLMLLMIMAIWNVRKKVFG